MEESRISLSTDESNVERAIVRSTTASETAPHREHDRSAQLNTTADERAGKLIPPPEPGPPLTWVPARAGAFWG